MAFAFKKPGMFFQAIKNPAIKESKQSKITVGVPLFKAFFDLSPSITYLEGNCIDWRTCLEEIEFMHIRLCLHVSYPLCIQQGLHSGAFRKFIFWEYPKQSNGREPPKIMVLGMSNPFAMCISKLSGPMK